MKSHRNEEHQQKKSFNSQVSNLQPFKNMKQNASEKAKSGKNIFSCVLPIS